MRRASFFYNCNCGGTYGTFPFTFPAQQAIPCLPPTNGALIADERYRSLVQTRQGMLLVVPLGGNSQTFLTPATGQGSDDFLVVLGPDGQARPTRTPTIQLTPINPAVSSVYPAPGGWGRIIIQGTGGNWGTVAAPSAGDWVVQVHNGQFVLVDAGTVPGLNQVGGSATTVIKGQVLVISEPTSGNFILNKLRVADKRVLVGDVDAGTGAEGFECLPDGSFLIHPKAQLAQLQSKTYEALDDSGSPVSGGLPACTVVGTGSISDPTRLVYSPTTKRLYSAPPHSVLTTGVSVNSASTVPPTGYTNMPGGHGAGQLGTYNYSNVRIDFHAGLSNGAVSNTQNFGIFRDGVLIAEFDNDILQTVSICYIDQNVPFGTHTYDVRWKKNSGTTAVIIGNSYLAVTTLVG